MQAARRLHFHPGSGLKLDMRLLILRRKMRTDGQTTVSCSRTVTSRKFYIYGAIAVYGPSDLPFSDKYPKPKAMTEDDMKYVEDAFVSAIDRCEQAGCKSTDYDTIYQHF